MYNQKSIISIQVSFINISDKTQIIIETDYLKHHFTPDFGLGGLVLNNNHRIKTQHTFGINKFPGTTWQYQTNEITSGNIKPRN